MRLVTAIDPLTASGSRTSLDPVRPKGGGLKPKCAHPRKVAEAIERAGDPKCPRFRGRYLVSLPDVEVAVPLRCRSQRCPYCRRFKALAAAVVVQRAIERATGRVRFMTLTDGRGDMTSVDMSRAWRRLSRRLDRRNLLGQYVRVLEVTKAGRLHYHVLLFETKRGGGFIPQTQLSEFAEASGFGAVTDIRAVEGGAGESARSLSAYVTKSGVTEQVSEAAARVARYVTKAGPEDLGDLAEVGDKLGERVRPVTTSQGFIGGSLAETETEICRYFGEVARGEKVAAETPEMWELWGEFEVISRLAAHRRRSRSRGRARGATERKDSPTPREAERGFKSRPTRGDPALPAEVQGLRDRGLPRAA